MPTTTYTATRTWNGPRTKATVIVTDESGAVIDQAGGKRAERAAAVILTRWEHRDPTPGAVRIYGLRSDASAAATEAHKLVTATTMRHGGAMLPVTPAAEAYAVPVVEADAAADPVPVVTFTTNLPAMQAIVAALDTELADHTELDPPEHVVLLSALRNELAGIVREAVQA